MDTSERIASRVTIDPTTGCWLWQGAVDTHGYGAIKVQGRMRGVHRVMLIATTGPLPDGYEVDHRCHTTDPSCPGGRDDPHRRCCNPAHLEAVPPGTNRDRSRAGFTGDRCQAGLHRIDLPGSTITNSSGRRLCVECRRASKRKANAAWRARHKED